jgi:hypothetical protein
LNSSEFQLQKGIQHSLNRLFLRPTEGVPVPDFKHTRILLALAVIFQNNLNNVGPFYLTLVIKVQIFAFEFSSHTYIHASAQVQRVGGQIAEPFTFVKGKDRF